MKNAKLTLLIILVFVAISCLFVSTIFTVMQSRHERQIRDTKVRLNVIRRDIDMFKLMNDRYPHSLEELENFMRTSSKGNTVYFYYDFTDGLQTSINESDVLDGPGGWYYDKQSGTLKINYTKPVKYYFRFFMGSYRNEIPSEW